MLTLSQETMFSGSYLYQVSGDAKYADRVERITYNALPATLTGGDILLIFSEPLSPIYAVHRHVVEAVSAATEPDSGAKYDSVSAEPHYCKAIH